MSKQMLGTLVVALGGFLLFIFSVPAYQEMQAARAALTERTQLLEDARIALENVHNLDGTFEANREKMNRILVSVPRTARSDYITSSIQQAAIQSGVQLSSIAIGATTEKKGADYRETEVSLDVGGRYVDVLRFFSALEASLRLYDIRHVELSKVSVGQGSSALRGTVRLVTYSLQ